MKLRERFRRSLSLPWVRLIWETRRAAEREKSKSSHYKSIFPPSIPDGRKDGRKAQLRIFAARLSRSKISPLPPTSRILFFLQFPSPSPKICSLFLPPSSLFCLECYYPRAQKFAMRHHDNDFPQIFSPSLKCFVSARSMAANNIHVVSIYNLGLMLHSSVLTGALFAKFHCEIVAQTNFSPFLPLLSHCNYSFSVETTTITATNTLQKCPFHAHPALEFPSNETSGKKGKHNFKVRFGVSSGFVGGRKTVSIFRGRSPNSADINFDKKRNCCKGTNLSPFSCRETKIGETIFSLFLCCTFRSFYWATAPARKKSGARAEMAQLCSIRANWVGGKSCSRRTQSTKGGEGGSFALLLPLCSIVSWSEKGFLLLLLAAEAIRAIGEIHTHTILPRAQRETNIKISAAPRLNMAPSPPPYLKIRKIILAACISGSPAKLVSGKKLTFKSLI